MQMASSEKSRISSSEGFCPKLGHENQPFSYFCTAKVCNKPLCSECVMKDHQGSGHEVKNIDDVFVSSKRFALGYLQDIRKMKTTLNEAVDHTEKEIGNLHLREIMVDEDIDAHFNVCQKALERRRGELKEKLAALCRNEKKSLDKKLDRMKGQKAKLERICQFTEDHIHYKNVSDILLIKDQISTKVKSLESTSVASLTTVDITFKPQNMEEDFVKFCQNLGQVCTSMHVPNGRVQTLNIATDKEQIPIVITMRDYENRPIEETGLDIQVEIANTKGEKFPADVADCVATQGCYNVLFTAPHPGEYRGLVSVNGSLLTKEGYAFTAQKPAKVGEHHLSNTSSRVLGDKVRPKQCKKKEPVNFVERLDDMDKRHANSPSTPMSVGEVVCPDLAMDLSHLHAQNELSDDKKTQTNQKRRHKIARNLTNAFKAFRGTIATHPLDATGQQYFEMRVHFFIKRSLRQDLIFEAGLCRKADVDKYYTIDGHKFAYAVCARKCHICRTICMQAWNNGKRYCHYPITENPYPGTTHRGVYGFLLDAYRRQWVVVDVKNRRLMAKFKNVDLTVPLWPVFGVYNPDLCNTYLTLRSGNDITTVLEMPSDM